MSQRGYHQRAIKRHYSGVLRGLAHARLYRQRGFHGIKLGPANRGRRLNAVERLLNWAILLARDMRRINR
jgi:hypothetical protein